MNIDDLPNYLGKRTHEETEVDSEVLAAVGDSSASAEFGLVEAVGEKRTCQQGVFVLSRGDPPLLEHWIGLKPGRSISAHTMQLEKILCITYIHHIHTR
eukprot:m.153439 g.153439  ORF g.153439 m.153439 type:complete len:99 (-) comp16233_c3_seq2:83-379(-)